MIELKADVLVIGGGPAGCWAAHAAAESGASVVLAEKGYVGTAGATAAGNTTIIYAAPGSPERAGFVRRRLARGEGLVDADQVDRVADQTWRDLTRLAEWGYAFPKDDDGNPFLGSMRGADYLRFMRQRLIKQGVTILDQSPALALLGHGNVLTIAGARGVNRVTGVEWSVHAGAVVIATGGCAFLSGALGTNNLTGDGYLMGAEAGAPMSGMEFTGQYGIAPAFSSVTKGIIYFWASLYDADHRLIEETGDRQEIVAKYSAHGPVYAVLDKAPAHVREGMRRGQPNIFLPFDRRGIDPFTQKFEIALRYEGTVRGVGGLLADERGATQVPGLYAAGDAVAREPLSGAASGGGGPNAAWALATGVWSGQGASKFARSLGEAAQTRALFDLSEPLRASRARPEVRKTLQTLQEQILPLDRSFYRDPSRLAQSSARLEGLWRESAASATDGQKARELTAMIASAQWIAASAALRTETRGIHRRVDAPHKREALTHRVLSGGLGKVWAQFERPFRKAVGQ